ncbi:MAG: 3-deoxy-manno-octulosonate cytidylyltransferase [Saprospiraceae bacterium]
MKTSIIIPARLASTRLPSKPLVDILGRSLIMRVYDRAMKVKSAAEVIVATDHTSIFDHVMAHGGHAVMTSDKHTSGTDRVAEVSASMTSDIIINVQGDEPLIDPQQIESLIQLMLRPEVKIGTQCKKIEDENHLFDYNIVKVVKSYDHKALYFSRQAIPAIRDEAYARWLQNGQYYRHVGIYGFKKKTLAEVTQLTMTDYESAEALEQLRWMQHGYTIHCIETDYPSIGVDTAEDVEKVTRLLIKENWR